MADRPGVRLAVDVGTVRVGLAASDPDGRLAFPLDTLPAGAGCVERVAALAVEHGAVEVVVGLPVTLAGGESASTRLARRFADRLAALLDVPVRAVDERLTTSAGTRALAAAGVRGRAARRLADQAAAVVLLQSVLDAGR